MPWAGASVLYFSLKIEHNSVDIVDVELTPRRVKSVVKAKHRRGVQRHGSLERSRPSMPLVDLPALRTGSHLGGVDIGVISILHWVFTFQGVQVGRKAFLFLLCSTY